MKQIIGLDEAGRGALAGPVVAAAVSIKGLLKISFSDSKKMNESQRERVFTYLSSLPQVKWGIGIISSQVVDRVNVLEATKIAMKKAISNLKEKGENCNILVIDGNFFLGTDNIEITVIKGDETVTSCKVAGIVAKVSRDRIMRRYAIKHKGYLFEKNKGYGTEEHRQRIKSLGFSPIHRRTFKVCNS